jgi:hypothetical protein
MRYARDHRPDMMGGPQPAAPDDEVMGQPEPEETEIGVMGGPGQPDEVMRGQARPAGLRYGTRHDTDVMGGPSEPTDVMSPEE